MNTNSEKPNISVAVFDSGIGGLNLLKECSLNMPDVEFYYLADNYNVPYGTKSKEQIFSLVKSAIKCVEGVKPSAAVIACNTATANCIEELRSEFSFPIIGIQPAIKQAAEYGGRCLVLATPSTVKSPSFNDLLKRCERGNATEFTVFPCSGLADYIEQNAFDYDEKSLSDALPDIKVDSVVLGCTHYVFIKNAVQCKYDCKIFDGIAGTVDRLVKILGMDDHIEGNSGNFDHQNKIRSNITFLGGDIAKNALVFSHLLNK